MRDLTIKKRVGKVCRRLSYCYRFIAADSAGYFVWRLRTDAA
ncbi:MAG: hypothetical protein WBI53_00675 [Paludibacter sp.]